MFTLIYDQGQLSKPNNIVSFLESNLGNSPLLQIDCVSPFLGSSDELINLVCQHLNSIDPQYEVHYNITQNTKTETIGSTQCVNYMVIQININHRIK